jgi:hypothetical protein
MATYEQAAQDLALQPPGPTQIGAVPDLLGTVGRGLVIGATSPIEQLSKLTFNTAGAQDMANLRREMETNEVGDVLPVNTPENQNLLTTYAGSLARSAAPAAAFSVSLPLGLAVGALDTQQRYEDQEAARQAQIAAGQIPDTPEQNPYWEHLKSAALLGGFSVAGRAAQPLLRPAIAAAPTLLRTPAGILGHGLSNLGIDAALRTGEHALTGQPLAPFGSAREAAEAAGAATAFGIGGGIEQAHAQTQLINKIQPDIAAGKAVSAAALKASGLRVPENYTLEENKTTGDFYRPKTEAELILPNASKTAAELAGKPTTSPEAETAAKEAEAAIAQETVQPPQAGEVPPAPAVEPYTGPGSPEFRRQEAIDAFNPARNPEAAAPIAADLLRQNLLRQQQIAEQRAAIERQQRLENPTAEVAPETAPTGEVPPVTTEARAQAEVAGETAKATEAAKQKTAEERIAEIDKEMDALVEKHGFNEDTGELNDTNPADKARYDAISKERVALFNGDESSLGKTPVTETGDTGVPPPVAETAQRGAGVPGDAGVPPVSEPAPIPVEKPIAKKGKSKKGKTNEEAKQTVSAATDNAGTNVQGEQGAGPRPDAGVAAGVESGAAHGQAPRPALSEAEAKELAANRAEQAQLFNKKKLTPADEKRIDELQSRADELNAKAGVLPAKNVDGFEKSPAADLVRAGGATAHDLLSKIAHSDKPYSELARHLADRFAPLLRKLGIDYDPNGREAQYNPMTHRVLVGEKRLSDEVLVHEIVHGITANTVFNAVRKLFPTLGIVTGDTYIDALRKTSKASGVQGPVRDIIKQYLHYLDSLPKEQRDAITEKGGLANRPEDWRSSKHPFHYGATSLNEFISEAFTDSQFRRDLNSIKAPGGGTIWSKIVDSVRRLLGADVDQKSLLAAVLDTSGKLGDLNEPNAKGEYGLLPAKNVERTSLNDEIEKGLASSRGEFHEFIPIKGKYAGGTLHFTAGPHGNPAIKETQYHVNGIDRMPDGTNGYNVKFDARYNRQFDTREQFINAISRYRKSAGQAPVEGVSGGDESGTGLREAPLPAKRIENESPLARPEEEGKDRIPEGFAENRLGTTYQDVPSTNEGRTVRFGGPAGEVRGAGGEAQQGATLRSGDNAGGPGVGEAPLPAKRVEGEEPAKKNVKWIKTDEYDPYYSSDDGRFDIYPNYTGRPDRPQSFTIRDNEGKLDERTFFGGGLKKAQDYVKDYLATGKFKGKYGEEPTTEEGYRAKYEEFSRPGRSVTGRDYFARKAKEAGFGDITKPKEAEPVTQSDYYKSLNDHLGQYGWHIEPRLFRGEPRKTMDILDEGGNLVGRVERSVENGALKLEYVDAAVDHTEGVRRKTGQGILDKIYPHDLAFAKKNGLDIRSKLISDIAVNKFKEHFGKRALEEDMTSVVKNADLPTRTIGPNPLPAKQVEEEINPGFYSKLGETIARKMPATADVATIKGIIANGGLKAEELKWSGIIPWLEGQKGKVTKQEVQDYLRNEGAVRFEEKTLKGPDFTPQEIEAKKSALDRANEKSGTAFKAFSKKFEDTMVNEHGVPREAAEAATKTMRIGDMENYRKFAPEELAAYEQAEKNATAAFDDYQGAVSEGKAGAPKFNRPDLVLPGGENYREVVLTVPTSGERRVTKAEGSDRDVLIARGYSPEGADIALRENPEVARQIIERHRGSTFAHPPTSDFTSSHFPESGNYVAHMRLNERPDSTGAKGTFIEEIQSDRHQKGRERGYIGDRSTEKWKAKEAGDGLYFVFNETGQPEGTFRGTSPADAIREAAASSARMDAAIDNKIPDAPYRKDWGVQMFKRALRDAIAKGQDWVGWTKGITQVERYTEALRQAVDHISWITQSGEDKLFSALKSGDSKLTGRVDKDGIVHSASLPDANGKPLAEVVGKEAAAKILKEEKGDLKGNDLTIGGEGMKSFYDSTPEKLGLVDLVGKYVKQWGGKVEEGRTVGIGGGGGDWQVRLNDGSFFGSFPSEEAARAAIERAGSDIDSSGATIERGETPKGVKYPEGTPFHKVAITPEMRASVQGVGQPLFAKHIEEAPTPAASRASFKDKLTEALRGNKYGARLLRRLAPGVRDVEDTITRTIDGKDYESAKAAGMVRDTLTRELPDKKDQAAAYVVLDNGGGRANDADSTAAENLAFHRLQEQRAFLEENLAKATKGPQAQEIQDKIASIEENMARLQEPAPTVDEVKARIQTEIDKGQAALESEEVPEERKKVIRENLPHYQRAYDNAERLVPAAKLAKRAYDDAYLLRQTVDPTGAYYQDYAGRLYEYNQTRGGAQIPPDSLVGGRSGIQRYNKERSYDTLMDAMIGRRNSQGTWEGETPLSLALPDVVANHVKNSNDFVGNETVKDDLSLVRDPQTNEPILLPKLKPGQEAPANYVKVNGPSGEDTWVYKPFADIFRTVWSPDAMANSDIGRASGTAASILKHGTVLYDIFHPSRLIQIGFFEALADGKFTAAKDRLSDYITQVVKPAMLNGEHGEMGKFLAEFNVDPRDIDRYVEKKIITKETADYLRSDEYKQHAKQMKEGGLRPQLFVDNLWSQAEPFLRKMMSKVHGEFAVDAQMKLNKATFERLAPAMMSAVFKWRRAEFARQNPELSSVQISRQAAKETNERFGNLGKSGPLKSATANSLAQRIALAPHWVISQLMSEGRGFAQMGKAVLDATYGRKMPNGQRERVFRLGNSAKFLATTMGTVFAMNQLVNMATRGHPTWQNPEDDHKFDAWLPGGKTGFFYSPTTLAAEYTHHFHNYHKFESAGSAIAHIATNKLSPMGQAAKIALTQKNYKGEKLSTLGTVGEVAKALTPVPISLGSAAQPLNPWASPSKSGQLTNNLARTMGVQLDRAPDAVAQAYESFKKYRTKERPDMGPSPYRDLKTLVQNEASPEKIKAEVDRLMKDGKKMQDIRQSFMAQFHPSGSVVGDITALQAEPRLTATLTAARKQKQAEREYFFKALQAK